MIEGYIVLANRIRNELVDLERVLSRAEEAIVASHEYVQKQNFYIDSAALSLHDIYTGLERIFQLIATRWTILSHPVIHGTEIYCGK